MDGILENLIAILVFSAIMGIAVFFIIRYFKNMPKRTEALLDSAYELETIGIKRNASGYGGTYKNYLVSIYATASNMGHGRLSGNCFQVWLSIAPEPGQTKNIGGFSGKYMVLGEKNGYAMIGFIINKDMSNDCNSDMINELDRLIDVLKERGIKPFIVTN